MATPRQQKLRDKYTQALQDPNVQKMLNAIGGSESSNQYDIQYDGTWSGRKIDTSKAQGVAGHPGTSLADDSSAAGRYMITGFPSSKRKDGRKSTWERAVDALGLTDFNDPTQQDLAATWLLDQRKYSGKTGLELAKAGDFAASARAAAPEWHAIKEKGGDNYKDWITKNIDNRKLIPFGQISSKEVLAAQGGTPGAYGGATQTPTIDGITPVSLEQPTQGQTLSPQAPLQMPGDLANRLRGNMTARGAGQPMPPRDPTMAALDDPWRARFLMQTENERMLTPGTPESFQANPFLRFFNAISGRKSEDMVPMNQSLASALFGGGTRQQPQAPIEDSSMMNVGAPQLLPSPSQTPTPQSFPVQPYPAADMRALPPLREAFGNIANSLHREATQKVFGESPLLNVRWPEGIDATINSQLELK